MRTTRAQRRMLKKEAAAWPARLVEIPRKLWPAGSEMIGGHTRLRVLRSREFLVQEFRVDRPMVLVLLSINRAVISGDRWRDGISWDELQRLKREAGHGDRDAVEIFPSDIDEVNVANMRHLWVMAAPLPFPWRRYSE